MNDRREMTGVDIEGLSHKLARDERAAIDAAPRQSVTAPQRSGCNHVIRARSRSSVSI